MEAQSPRSRIGGSWTEQLLASRRGAIAVAAAAALLAGILLYLFVSHYRQTSTSPTVVAAPSKAYVFVASHYIAQGTPASTVIAEGLLHRTQVPTAQAVAGAIADPSAITGEVAGAAISAGQQITDADFTRSAVSLGSYLSGTQRALAIPLDAPHGLTAYVAPGDHVDVMIDSAGVTRLVGENIEVLANQGGDVVLRVDDSLALQLETGSDNDKIWLVLRAPMGSKNSISVGTESK